MITPWPVTNAGMAKKWWSNRGPLRMSASVTPSAAAQQGRMSGREPMVITGVEDTSSAGDFPQIICGVPIHTRVSS